MKFLYIGIETLEIQDKAVACFNWQTVRELETKHARRPLYN